MRRRRRSPSSTSTRWTAAHWSSTKRGRSPRAEASAVAAAAAGAAVAAAAIAAVVAVATTVAAGNANRAGRREFVCWESKGRASARPFSFLEFPFDGASCLDCGVGLHHACAAHVANPLEQTGDLRLRSNLGMLEHFEHVAELVCERDDRSLVVRI